MVEMFVKGMSMQKVREKMGTLTGSPPSALSFHVSFIRWSPNMNNGGNVHLRKSMRMRLPMEPILPLSTTVRAVKCRF